MYGAVCFPPSPVTDFDAHVLVTERLSEDDRVALRGVHKSMRSIPGGDDLDVWYITLEDAARTEGPLNQWDPAAVGNVDNSWAIHRAHVLAGRYVSVSGPDPIDFVPKPTWVELDHALQCELVFVTKGLDRSPAYCTLNLCRILASYESRDVVMSKLQAALWATGALPSDSHGLIRTALGMYHAHDFEAENAMHDEAKGFFEEMSVRIAKARAG